MKKPKLLTIFATFAAVFTIAHFFGAQTQKPTTFSDYRTQAPGVMHKITVADLPEPYATTAVDNGPRLVSRPKDAWPKAPAGFKVELYASGLENPREIRTAPNGDLFVAESQANRIRVLRGRNAEGKAETLQIFASGLRQPFGIAFFPAGWSGTCRVSETERLGGSSPTREHRRLRVVELGTRRFGRHATARYAPPTV